ncbi:hypothetical protein ABW21_db0204230 [Orbilia brochopaga]|nr:hypothetical protein ABW21_db0204230 [Drechslerella brochopaga]
MHTLSGGWHQPVYPYVVGHEIVGRAVRVGSKVSHIKIGDRVGVGAQSDACLECDLCKSGNEAYCEKFAMTYDGVYNNGDRTMGGYADHARVPGSFVINLNPYDKIPSDLLAPMMCGGVTMFSPLKRYGAGPGKRVGIIGLGGLGHFGVMFAKALGSAEVVVISRSRAKESDAKKLGADRIIATQEPGWATKNASSLDLIVGAPDGNMPGFNGFNLFMKNRTLTGTLIGSRKEIQEMLQLANETGVKTWANPFPMAKVNDAIKAFNRSEARYRIVLINEKNLEANQESQAVDASAPNV